MWSNSSQSKNHSNTTNFLDIAKNNKRLILLTCIALSLIFSAAAVSWYNAVPPSATVTPKTEAAKESDPEPNPVLEKAETPKTEVEVSTQTDPSTQTELRINDQTTTLPSNGTVNKSIEGNNGNADVDISVNSRSSGSAQNHSSMNIQLNSKTEVESSSRTSIE